MVSPFQSAEVLKAGADKGGEGEEEGKGRRKDEEAGGKEKEGRQCRRP